MDTVPKESLARNPVIQGMGLRAMGLFWMSQKSLSKKIPRLALLCPRPAMKVLVIRIGELAKG